jgi:hypothetical protein
MWSGKLSRHPVVGRDAQAFAVGEGLRQLTLPQLREMLRYRDLRPSANNGHLGSSIIRRLFILPVTYHDGSPASLEYLPRFPGLSAS